MLNNAPADVESQLVALLHEVGKPSTQETIDGLIRLIGHEKVSGEIVESILRRLKFESGVVKRVRTMVENHMRPHNPTRGDVSPKALRKFVQDVGIELVDAILDSLGNLPPKNLIFKLRKKLMF